MEESKVEVTESTVETKAKTYTQEEVDKMLQAESDRRVSMALKKREKEISEAAKINAMNEDEKTKYQLEQREKALAEREQLIAINENKYEAVKMLADKGLPTEFAEYCVNPDAEVTVKNIKNIEKIFNKAVAEAIKSKIGYAPSAGGKTAPMTKEQFFKLSINEQQKLYTENPELYRNLIK